MNEQLIKDLALKSRFEVHHAGIATVNFWVSEKLENYTRLILEECTTIIEDAVNQREPASTYVDKIKQRFGV